MDILTVIREFLHDRLGADPSTIQLETTLEALKVDSLMLVELIFECEEKFEVNFDRDTPTPKTIADLVRIVENYMATARPPVTD
jgi:acyl carrier protein